jgi:S1-C subfamily serine protease
VLVMMGGRPVVDLATFTAALRAHSPGELVELTVRREGKTLNFTVVLGNRVDRK